MKKLIFLFCLLGTLTLNAQVWRQSDGSLRTLNADLTLANIVPSDFVYKINGAEFITPIPVCPKYYRSDKVLGIALVNNRIIVKYTGYINRGEWIGRIVWKRVYHVSGGNIVLQGIVDGNYTPPQTTEEQVTFQDE